MSLPAPALTPEFTRQTFAIVPATPAMRDMLCACHRDVRFGTDINLVHDYAVATKNSGYYEAFWQHALEAEGHITLAAFSHDDPSQSRLAGFIRMGPADPYPSLAANDNVGELHQIYIHPDYQGHGLGRLLYIAGTEALAAAGRTGMMINALVENTGALGFYDHMGARTVEHVTEHKERDGRMFTITCAILRHDF